MRLIDAEEVANCYERMMKNLDEKNALPEQITEFAVAREYLQWASYVINNTPTVDAVSRGKYKASEDARHILVEFADDLLAELKERIEVVRCKDCEFSPFWFGGNGNWKLCPLVDDFVREQTRDDYCSYGKRREEE